MAKFCMNCGAFLNGRDECPICAEPVSAADKTITAEKPVTEGTGPAVAAAEQQPAETPAAELRELQPAKEETREQVLESIPREPQGEADKPEDKAPPRRSRYAPVSTFGFLVMLILLCIPVLNLVLLLVWARKDCRRVNRRNFARAVLCLILLAAVIAAAVYFFGDVLFGDVVRTYAVQLEEWGLGSLVTMWG